MKKTFYPLLAVFITCSPALTMAAGHEQLSQEEQDARAMVEMFPKDALSESDVYRADQLLISATGSLKPVHLAPSVATVITAAQIEKMGATTLDEILETVPGLHVAPSGLNAFSSIWSIRGVRTNINPQVLLLLNGVGINSATNGGRVHRYNMPVSMISRVEVIRGPGSAIYGADAFAGTINVITKDGHEVDGTQTGIRYGSFETIDGWLQHGASYGSWNVVAGIEVRKTDGDDNRVISQDGLGSAPPSLAPGPLDTRREHVDLNLAVNKDDRWIGRFYGSWVNDTGMGPGAIQVLNNNGSTIKNNQYLLDLIYNNSDIIADLDLSLKGSHLYQKGDNYFQFYPSGMMNMLGNPIATMQTTGLELVGKYNSFTSHVLRSSLGVKYYKIETDQYKNFGPGVSDQFGALVSVKGTPYIFMENQDRTLWYLSLQDEWSLARGWALTAGVRYDDYNDIGSTTNPRLALVWETMPELTSKLMYGRAFRAPSFQEQHFQANPVITGNSNLAPETIDTYELAFDWQPTNNLRIVPSFFYYEIEGLIEFVGPLPSQAQNNGARKGQGLELEADWQVIDNLQLKANFSYQRSKNKETDELIADTPEVQFYTEANWAFLPEWNLNGQYIWIGDRHRASNDPRSDIDDYGLVNVTLRRKNIAKHWDVAMSVRNLFDEDAREPSPYDPAAPLGAQIPDDYPMEGRAFWAELRFHF